ncbi:MAG: lipopolysaccharide biosynthesis protein, partial [bacterium]
MTACSVWVVRILLGPGWETTAHIFQFLGLLAVIQPINNSTGWLYISQDRTGDMFRWGLIGSSITITSFVVGLPWGAIGVAASYTLFGLILKTPLLWWYVTRRGPILGFDFLRVSQIPLYGAILAGMTSYGFYHYFANSSYVLSLTLTAGVLHTAVFLSWVSIWPSGREAVIDFWNLITD